MNNIGLYSISGLIAAIIIMLLTFSGTSLFWLWAVLILLLASLITGITAIVKKVSRTQTVLGAISVVVLVLVLVFWFLAGAAFHG